MFIKNLHVESPKIKKLLLETFLFLILTINWRRFLNSIWEWMIHSIRGLCLLILLMSCIVYILCCCVIENWIKETLKRKIYLILLIRKKQFKEVLVNTSNVAIWRRLLHVKTLICGFILFTHGQKHKNTLFTLRLRLPWCHFVASLIRCLGGHYISENSNFLNDLL